MPQFRAGQRLTVDLMNLLTQAPLRSDQINPPAFNVTGSWVDFPDADFPSLTLTVPAAARLRVTVSAKCLNNSTSASTCYLSWRGEGANTIEAQYDAGIGGGTTMARASGVYITGALNAGVTTIVPQWIISSGSGSTATLVQGHLFVELLP